MTAQQFQATFDSLLQQGFRPVIVSGYAENGQARYAAIWEQSTGPAWQARHGMSRAQYQQTFDEMLRQGFILTHVSAYRVNVDVLFAGIWERQDGVTMQTRHALTSSAYQSTFDQMVAAGMKLTCVCGVQRHWNCALRGDLAAAAFGTVAGAPWPDGRTLSARIRPPARSGLHAGPGISYGDGFYAA